MSLLSVLFWVFAGVVSFALLIVLGLVVALLLRKKMLKKTVHTLTDDRSWHMPWT